MNCDTCIICLENVSNQENIFERIGQWNYLQTCSCQFHVHNTCFQQWYMCSGKCPYGKEKMYIRELYYWQYYGKPSVYDRFHFAITIWTFYILYKTLYDFDSYVSYGNIECDYEII